MFGYGLGPILHNLNMQIEGSGGYQLMGQRHYESFAAELERFFTGGGKERIIYRQTGAAWLGSKGLYALLYIARWLFTAWALTRDIPANHSIFPGALALATVIPAVLFLVPWLLQLTAGPVMTPERFRQASLRFCRRAMLDCVAQFLVGGITVIWLLMSSRAAEAVCGLGLIAGGACSLILWLLETRRKCTVFEPENI